MSELATKIGAIADSINEFKSEYGTRVSEIEKRMARDPHYNDNGYANDNRQSLGDIVANSDAIKDLSSSFRGKTVVKINGENAAITSGTATVGAATSGSTSLVQSHRVDGIITPYQRQFTIRDLVGQARTTSNLIEFPVETAFTNNAAPVAETTAKPYSDLTFNLKSAPVRTLAHLFKASRQILDDAPALAAYIERRGTYGLKFVEENQVLNGAGTGQNLLGIVPQATDYETARNSTGDQALDVLNHAISQAEEAELPVSGIVISKKMWRDIIGIKDEDGRYLSSGPFSRTNHTIWDLPVLATNAFADDEFLVGAFKDGATIYDRLDVEVLISTENEDDFIKNLATVRIEERLALAVFRPDAFITGLFPSLTG
jgi:HK97 family phage major capsid protein